MTELEKEAQEVDEVEDNSNPPSFTYSITATHPYSVELSVTPDSPLYLWCLPRPTTETVPSVYDITLTQLHTISEKSSLTIYGLKPSITYNMYCYAESLSNKPMKVSPADMAKPLHNREWYSYWRQFHCSDHHPYEHSSFRRQDHLFLLHEHAEEHAVQADEQERRHPQQHDDYAGRSSGLLVPPRGPEARVPAAVSHWRRSVELGRLVPGRFAGVHDSARSEQLRVEHDSSAGGFAVHRLGHLRVDLLF